MAAAAPQRISTTASTATKFGALTIAPGVPMDDPDRYDPGAPPVHYPDPDVVAVTPAFNKYIVGNSAIKRLWTGALWAEGPAWSAVGRFFLWSDIPNDIQLRWLEEAGFSSVDCFWMRAGHAVYGGYR